MKNIDPQQTLPIYYFKKLLPKSLGPSVFQRVKGQELKHFIMTTFNTFHKQPRAI